MRSARSTRRTPARRPSRASIGEARHFAGKQGIFCGDKIPNYPAGASSHSTEAWFRAERPNATIIGWGNEGGGRGSKVRMQLRSPPHLHIDSDFSDVRGEARVPLGEWVHVVHTYDDGEGKVYINGRLDAAAKPPLDIKSPARLWIGGWYHNYDFVGDIDEVRDFQGRALGRLDPPGVRKPEAAANAGRAGGAAGQRVLGLDSGSRRARRARASTFDGEGGRRAEGLLDREARRPGNRRRHGPVHLHLRAGRVVGDQSLTLQFKAVYPDEVKTKDDRRSRSRRTSRSRSSRCKRRPRGTAAKTIEVVPQIANLKEMQAKGAGKLNYAWTVSDIAVDQGNRAGQTRS